jgi:hypothetical protein
MFELGKMKIRLPGVQFGFDMDALDLRKENKA